MVSAAQVFTGQSGGRGDNSGSAAILDQHPDFLPYAQRIYENKRAEDVERAKQEREAAKEFQKVLKGPDLGAVPLRAQQQIQEGLTKYKQLALDMGTGKIKGKDGRKLNPLDPYDLEAASLLQAEELKLKSLKAAADNQDAYIMKALEASKDPKYSKKHLTERLGELKNAKTIEDVEAWMEVNPLKVNRGTIDIVHDLAPKLYTAISETGNKTTLTEAITKDNMDVLVEDHLNTEQGLEDLEAGIIDGRWKDEESMKEAIYKSAAAQNPGKKSTTFDEPKVSNANNSNNANSDGDVVANPTYDQSVSADSQGRVNTVTFNYKNQIPKTIQLFDAGGNPVNAQALAVKKTPKGDGWVVVAQREVEEVVPYTPKEIEEIADAKLIDPSYVPEPKVKKVMKTETFPIDNTEGNVGNQNYKTISGMIKQDFQTLLGDQRDAAQGGQPATKVIKATETPQERLERLKKARK